MGLRERKKARTVRAIEDAALRLFEAQGFHDTTVAELAEAADISPRTFFGYFPSKESVLFGDFDATFDSLAARLRAREQGESAMDALRAWIVALLDDGDLLDEREARRRRVIEANEPLVAHERALMGRLEDVLAEAVAADLAASPRDLRPRLVAAAATAALIALRPDPDAPRPASKAEQLEPLDEALDFLRGGIAALLLRDAQPVG